MNIIFDLDGTLIDSRLRLYRLFQNLAPYSQLSFEQYWEFKQKKISNETILLSELGFKKYEVGQFITEWMGLIESPEYLAMDVNFPGIHSALTHLQKQAELHICTARQLRQPVLGQLERLDLLRFFNRILVTEQKHSKESLITTHISDLNTQDWMLGDTGKDIQAGKSLGVKTCAVLTGFLNKNSLSGYNPDLILNSVVDFSFYV